MSDTVSRKAVSDLVKNRLNKVLAGVGSAEDIKDPFDRGKATAYENVLYDISAKLPSTESEGVIESLKAITELAVKGLKWYADIDNHLELGIGGTLASIDEGLKARTTLSEIARLSI